MDWEQRCKELQQRIEELEKENRELRRKLGYPELVQSVVTEAFKTEVMQEPAVGANVHMRSTPEEKIRLFRSLFRGRKDVFARRWYSVQKGKGGYAPVCANEWRYGVCIKPKGKCSKCENRVLVPLDDAIIYNHLSGKDANGQDVIGLYPLLADDTCYFLAIDFDDGAWQENVTAVRSVCGEWGIPCGVERSRSGEGAHLWVFFEDAIPCATARKLGSALLTAAIEREGKLKLDAYDRMFPCQDTLPNGGFGNLIALPLQGQARKKGNSLFVDEMFRPFPDQWAYLSTMRKLGTEDVDALIKVHSHGDALGNLCVVESTSKPWERQKKVTLSALDFYGVQHIVRANMIYIPANGFAPRVRNQLLRLAAFRNPDFYKSQAMRLPIYDKPRIICAAEERDGYLALPRCCEPDLTELLETAGASYEIEDKTFTGNEIRVGFKGELRPEQIPAAEALLAHDNGVLSATTAFGKTVIASYLISQRKVNTLVLVHTQALLNQWKKALSEFLEINETLPEFPKKRGRKKERSLIGQLGGAKNNLSGFVDIAIMQSLISKDEVRELVKDYGLVIVDECHHVSAVSFEQVLKEVNAKYVYGLTATPARQDGHQPIIHMQCGPIRYQVDAKQQAEKRPFDHAVIPKFTSFAQPLTDETPWKITDAYAAMQINEERNNKIVVDVLTAVTEGRTPIVLTERYDHAKLLAEILGEKSRNVVLLSGKGTAKEKREILQGLSQIPADEPLILVATGRYVGEGFDLPRLDTLFLAMPVSWKGTLAQYAGRLHRNYEGKQEVLIYDYVDIRVPMLERMYHKRLSGYAAIGYTIRGDRTAPMAENRIFTQEEYWDTFSMDIANAQKDILITSPYLYIAQVKRFLKLIPEKTHVTVVTGDEPSFNREAWEKVSNAVKLLEDAGARVILQPKVYQRYAVIDKSTLWYGGINFLGIEKAAHGAMRLCSTELASELMSYMNTQTKYEQLEMY
ncbi:MAG: DEAD/DEAH box helicase family protein [Oscillospiraceae bacterium]|nr:DEAD/DEAH box helicase family protein [Oscillospiraceae bacterium]